jgi:pilus assembly protein Flp/PilA
MTKMLRKLAGDRSGATAIEYGLIAAFIALAMVAVLPGINTKLHNTFQNVDDGLQSAADANSTTPPAGG